MLSTELIERILSLLPQRTIGVLGDLFLDRYLDINAELNEPSVETGLTAYQVTRVRSYPGAAGTVINNLSALGVGRIFPIAYIGDDGEGYELRKALPKIPGVIPDWTIMVPDRYTPTYTKPMLNEAGVANELNRLDIKNRTPTPKEVEDLILQKLDQAWPQLDALIVLDQVSEVDCGVVTKRVRDHLSKLGEREPGKFVLADSREQIALFSNVCVKPNGVELKQLTSTGVGGSFLILSGRSVFATHGERGIELWEPSGKTGIYDLKATLPAFPVSGPIDIVGAGDSCSAGIAAAMVSGATHQQAAAFGNLIASITIQQIGLTGTASPEQVRTRWREVQGSNSGQRGS
ncbi:MAG TPA: PfkB family carbohydrate kinase [Gemmata sp.]|jgi:bifunctional ADP-heptose synthase (sugar kinase/adenylyltransferase)|nr:PfkB family carbohydrate kinase [Gemmata sp.]